MRKKMSDHDFLELYHEGLMDIEIAEIMDVSPSSVTGRRHCMGLPKNPQRRRNAKQYKVYNGETDKFVVEGTTWDIAQTLHVSESTVRNFAYQTRCGLPSRYRVCEVTG